MKVVGTTLLVPGAIAIVIGLMDPLEGMILILPGSGFIALGAFLAKTPHRRLAYTGFLFMLMPLGTGAFLSLALNQDGFSGWWHLGLLPFPVGWAMDLAAVAFALLGLMERPLGALAATVWTLFALGFLFHLANVLLRFQLITPWMLGWVALVCALCVYVVYLSEAPNPNRQNTGG